MNPHISLPRHNSTERSSSFGAAPPTRSNLQMPRILKRALKFPSMDFETAVWEMSSLLLRPTAVFKNIKRTQHTKKRYHTADPSFTYLLSFFLLLTSIAWGLAYADGFGRVVNISLVFVFGHFIGSSLVVSVIAYFLVGRLLGPGVKGLPGRRRQQGLFVQPGEEEQLEFGYCFDVAIRAFFPVWVFLYVLQFLLMPVVAKEYWHVLAFSPFGVVKANKTSRLSLLLGNSLYLLAFGYYTIITFLGYNALPFLAHTELLLFPTGVFAILWFASLFGFNMPRHLAPVLWAGANLRKGI